MRDLQRKAIQTWLVLTIAILGLPYLFADAFPYRTVKGEEACEARNLFGTACSRSLSLQPTETITDWLTSVQIVGATTIVTVLVVGYLRIWKRPDES